AGHPEVWDLADEVYRNAKERIGRHTRELIRNRDAAATAMGKSALSGKYNWLSKGIIGRGLKDYGP
ncbi:MAG: hypothetical protein ACRD88_04000, partial [Terriglobia bacterium]